MHDITDDQLFTATHIAGQFIISRNMGEEIRSLRCHADTSLIHLQSRFATGPHDILTGRKAMVSSMLMVPDSFLFNSNAELEDDFDRPHPDGVYWKRRKRKVLTDLYAGTPPLLHQL